MTVSTAEHIAAHALSVFYRHGFHASGVELLSQQAGVTKKTLYRHYPSKEALIDAALALRHRQFLAQIDGYVQAAVAADRPLAYIEALADWVRQDGFHGCAFINAAAEYGSAGASAHQQAVAHKQAMQQRLTEWCAAAGARSAESVALQLFLLGEGLIVASQVQGAQPQLLTATHVAAQTVWDAALGG